MGGDFFFFGLDFRGTLLSGLGGVLRPPRNAATKRRAASLGENLDWGSFLAMYFPKLLI
jgi:hypothetical protein